ncbi:fatty acid hydroxylase [Chthoniobacter flavus Ellin428]|uniref:Fatty acid hydroxylase n=1 Tax=Chthoniobacter flavus Ellin428 TaxID=497964 RepID=B4D1H7_9BACT|nr:sterol desaturase family protein [Chthoniobacter flavus]EDY19589.1 fatty acid hydroxylase [Chthoniobacter flavus Ellin428]TCO92830.1 sterol desaturase/sphingolipid hydroxylase (fatty acid hydroxylase superfamily) [Chthoniobacter flavus]
MIHQLLGHLSGLVVDVARLAMWLVVLVAIFVPLERLCALHPARIWRKQIGVDLAWYFINSIVPAAVISVPLALLARTLHELNPGGFYSMVAAWPLWGKLGLVLIVNDIGAYWGHRALHASPFLWRFHAVHHSAEQLDWLVNTRAHPFDMVFTRLSGLAPVYLLGLAQTTGSHIDPAVAGVTIFGAIWTFFIHANLRIRLGPLEWLISSPAFHHWHHTRDDHRDRNFSFVFPVIDRLFGTAWLPKEWPSVYGVNESISPTLSGQFFDPLDPPGNVEATSPQGTTAVGTTKETVTSPSREA